MAKCTVERLMRAHGWQGVRRHRKVRTTVADPAAGRAPDLVDRQFQVPGPIQLIVADFTYVPLATGVFVYVAFAIDAYAGRIVGWQASHSKQTRFVASVIRQAAALRAREGHRIHGAIHHWRCRVAIHVCALRRNPGALGAAALDRHGRGRLR